MGHYLGRAPHSQVTRSELVLRPRVDPLTHRPGLIAILLRPRQFRRRRRWEYLRQVRGLLGTPPPVYRNDRHMVELPALTVNVLCVIGRVHQIVEIVDAL